MGDWIYRKGAELANEGDARWIGIQKKCLCEGFLADVLRKVHGLVEDAGDFAAAATDTIKNQVHGDPQCAAAIGQVVSGFTAGEGGVVHDASSCESWELKVSGSLLDSPSFDGVAKDFRKIWLRKFRQSVAAHGIIFV